MVKLKNQKTKKETLVIVDGSAIIYRAYHALPSFTAPNGTPTNAVYGFAKMLLSLSDKLNPQYLSVAFDTPKPTFRKKILPSYQAQRPKAPDDFKVQIPLVQEFVQKTKISSYLKEGYEADDVIGSIAKNQNQSNLNVYVVTGDKDMLQLVDKQITVIMPVKGVSTLDYYDIERVKVKIGIEPSQIVDYKALMGDPSDNYPGVRGVGPKTAIKLLKQYQTLEGIYKNLDQIDDKVAKLLKKHQEEAWLSQELAQIRTNIKTGFSLNKSRYQIKTPSPELIEFLEKLGLYSLKKQITKRNKTDQREAKQVDKKRKKQLSFF